MIPLSTSRIYIFGVKYLFDDVKLVKQMHTLIKTRFSELSYRSIEIKMVKNKNVNKEIHFNHLFYRNLRSFDYDTFNMIRLKFIELFSLIEGLTYDQVITVNDIYDRRPSLGLSRQR